MYHPDIHGPRGRLLAIDDGKGGFGDLALRLVRLGVDVLFVAEADEGELLARQEGSALRGILLPSTTSVAAVGQVVEAIGPHTGIGAESIALMGQRIDDDDADRFREAGVRWRLWSPYEDRDLRFLGWALIWYTSDQNLRMNGRIPTALPATATGRGQERHVLVGDLSPSGAYLEMTQPFPAGSMLRIEIALPGGTIQLRGMVRWVSAQDDGEDPMIARRPRGCGVEFLRYSGEVRALLREHLDEEISRFEL